MIDHNALATGSTADEPPELLTTPLDAEHRALGGKMVPFAGWSMPVQYPTGIQAEHRAVREAAGLFDVSHMGEFHVEGPDALALVLKVAVNDASQVEVGQAQYSALCTPSGTVIDDLLVYRTAPDAFLLVVNASNRQVDWDWISKHAEGMDLDLSDRSEDTALLALQGPKAEAILAPLLEPDVDRAAPGGATAVPTPDLAGLGYYRFTHARVAGVPALVARTGYTGEDGFELYLPWSGGVAVWRAILEAGEPHGILPAGLGARDSLRLEVGYPLYGNDLDRDHTALESGLGWIVKLGREGDFVGREALALQKASGVERRLVGLRLDGRGFPRPGYPVVTESGDEVGVVTSGTVSPTLGEGIALAWLPTELAAAGTRVAIRVRDRDLPAIVQRPPFYTGGSIRR
jgi:aminomethyltransferase